MIQVMQHRYKPPGSLVCGGYCLTSRLQSSHYCTLLAPIYCCLL